MKYDKTKFKLLLIFSIFIIQFSILNSQDTWVQTYDPYPIGDGWYGVEDVIVCQDGGYAINGYWHYYEMIGPEEEWGFLMKTDSDGNLLWARSDTVSFMSGNASYAFIETEDGDFISIGYSAGGGYMIKRDSEGNRLWTLPYDDFGANSMCGTSDGNIILGGVVAGEIALRKIDVDGNTIWTNTHYCGNTTIAKSIIQTSDGGYALTGYTSGNGFDVIVMKTDAFGDSLWTSTYDGYGGYDEGRSIIENIQGDIFVSGYFEFVDRIDYGFFKKINENGEVIFTLTDDNSNSYYGCNSMVETITDNKIVCYGRDIDGPALNAFNYEGDSLWVSSINGWGGAGDRCLQKEAEGFIFCGFSPQYNISLTKTDVNGEVTAIGDELILLQDIVLKNYPNPFNPQTMIQFTLPTDVINPVIEIFNIKGQKVDELDINIQKLEVIWNADTFSSGVYLYNIRSNNYISKTKRMTLIK
jgi:hypothetical protein